MSTSKNFIILYNGLIKPCVADSVEDIEKRIQKDWNRFSNMDTDYFESCGLRITFSDYTKGKVQIMPLEQWYLSGCIYLK